MEKDKAVRSCEYCPNFDPCEGHDLNGDKVWGRCTCDMEDLIYDEIEAARYCCWYPCPKD